MIRHRKGTPKAWAEEHCQSWRDDFVWGEKVSDDTGCRNSECPSCQMMLDSCFQLQATDTYLAANKPDGSMENFAIVCPQEKCYTMLRGYTSRMIDSIYDMRTVSKIPEGTTWKDLQFYDLEMYRFFRRRHTFFFFLRQWDETPHLSIDGMRTHFSHRKTDTHKILEELMSKHFHNNHGLQMEGREYNPDGNIWGDGLDMKTAKDFLLDIRSGYMGTSEVLSKSERWEEIRIL